MVSAGGRTAADEVVAERKKRTGEDTCPYNPAPAWGRLRRDDHRSSANGRAMPDFAVGECPPYIPVPPLVNFSLLITHFSFNERVIL